MKRLKLYSIALISSLCLILTESAFARDVEYNTQEVTVRVNPGEPTQIEFPGVIQGGYKRKNAEISLDRRENQLVVFGQPNIPEQGEVILVRLDDGRSYSLRIQRASAELPRDDVIRILDQRDAPIPLDEEDAPYKEKNFEYAPATQVSGLIREMVLVTEFGKKSISGYRMSDRFQGEPVLNDGTINAVIDRIFIGPNLWGYVVETQNVLEVSQKLNPATFRLDGTRAISANNWELAPKPLSVEQDVAGKHKAKVYIVTKAH